MLGLPGISMEGHRATSSARTRAETPEEIGVIEEAVPEREVIQAASTARVAL